MKCLVLGGAGFIGGYVVNELVATGHDPVIGDVNAREDARSMNVDFQRTDSLMRALEHIDCVIHLAWATVPASATANPIDDVQQNVIGSLRLFSCCVARGVSRVVFCSTGGAIYGHPQWLPISEEHPTVPLSSYGVTKLATEAYLRMFGQLHGLEYVILRPGNAYGEGQRSRQNQGIVAACLDAIQHGVALDVWGDGSVVRDFVHAKDIARAVACATVTKAVGHTFNIGTGLGHSVNDIIRLARAVTGRPLDVRYQPKRSFDAHDNVLDCNKAAHDLGWRADVPLAAGIERQWCALLTRDVGVQSS